MQRSNNNYKLIMFLISLLFIVLLEELSDDITAHCVSCVRGN